MGNHDLIHINSGTGTEVPSANISNQVLLDHPSTISTETANLMDKDWTKNWLKKTKKPKDKRQERPITPVNVDEKF